MNSIDLHVRAMLGRGPRVSALGVALVLALPTSLPVLSAEQSGNESTGLDEVIVTAQFRSENLQDTPLAITAVSGERLEEQGLTNVADLGNIIPNANIRPNPGSGPNAQIGMRGVNTTEFIYTTEPGVAVYIDDVYHGTLTGSAMDLLDLERVEVLRGPQGTLFGKNALGGAIRLISRQPKGDNTGSVEATYGTSNRMDIKAGFDFGITDNLFMRVSGVSKRIDGYGKTLDFTCQMKANGTPALAGNWPAQTLSNAARAGDCKTGETGGSQDQALKAMLRFLATDKLEINLATDYARSVAQPGVQTLLRGTQSSGLDQLYNNLVVQPTYGIRYDDNRFVSPDPFTNYMSFADVIHGRLWPRDQTTDTWSTSAKLDYSFNDSVHMKVVAAHRGYDSDWSGPNLVPITGGVTAALMLSQAIWTAQTIEGNGDGWFSKSRDQWTEETGLSRWEQETARRALRTAGFLEERRIGVPAKLWFRVRPEAVWRALQARAGAIHR